VFDVAILIDALRRIADNETVIDPTIIARLVGRYRKQDPPDKLTEREREVLGLIAEGLSNSAIARRLVVTERTVQAHTTQIFQKLQLEANPDSHRRVMAVVTYLQTVDGGNLELGVAPGEHSCLSLVWAVSRSDVQWLAGVDPDPAGLRLWQVLRRQLLQPPASLHRNSSPGRTPRQGRTQPSPGSLDLRCGAGLAVSPVRQRN
jgi:DNA-binding CsgD family transcriptional regulator